MTIAARPVASLSLSLVLATIPWLGGCGEEPTAANASGFTERLERLAADYRKLAGSRALVGETGPLDDTTDLAGLLGGLNSLSGGTPEQQESAALLRAHVAADLARAEAARAVRIEVETALLFELVGTLADAAARLDAIAETKVPLASEREMLDRERAAADREAGTLGTAATELKVPVELLAADREARLEAIAELDTEIARLRRDATQAGARAGLPFTMEAAGLNEEAIRLRTESAVELGLLAAASGELELVETALAAARGRSGSAQTALRKLEDFAAALEKDAGDTRAVARSLRTEAETILEKIADLRGEPLDRAYAAALVAFGESEAAAGMARNVARETAEQLTIAGARERGTLLQRRIRGLDDEAALLERLERAGALGRAARTRPADLAARRGELLEEARTAYGEAMASLENMNADDPGVKRIRNALETSMALLEGQDAPTPAKPATGLGGGMPTASAGLAAPTAGFGSARELVDFVNAMKPGAIGPGLRLMQAMRASRPDARATLGSMVSLTDAIAPFIGAAEERFGSEAVAAGLGSGGGMGMGASMGASPLLEGVRDLSILSEDLDEATVTTGEGDTLTLRREGGRWFLDADPLLANLDPQALQGLAMAGPMMAMMKPAMVDAATSVAGRVRAGEFADAAAATAAFNAALQQALREAMGAMGGGMGGGGRP